MLEFRVFLRPVNFRQEFMQALEEAYEFYDLKKRDRDSRQERLKQLEGNRKAIAEIEKIIENQNESWKDFEVFAERLLGFTMERYGRNLNTEQHRQYFARGVFQTSHGFSAQMRHTMLTAIPHTPHGHPAQTHNFQPHLIRWK